jgi:hypothetical protein
MPMGDAFGDKTGELLVLGAKQVPVLSVVVELAETFLPKGADPRLREALEADFRDKVARLEARVERLEKQRAAEGKPLDELGVSRTVTIAREFLSASAGATSGKVDALVNGAARQFDPDAGLPSVREYWLRRVRELPDMELEVVRLLHKHGRLAVNGALFSVTPSADGIRLGNPFGSSRRADIVAIEVTALRMSKGSEPEQLLLREHAQVALKMNGQYENFTTSLFGLTPSGEELAAFIAA